MSAPWIRATLIGSLLLAASSDSLGARKIQAPKKAAVVAKKAAAPTPQSPEALIASRTQKVLAQLKSRPIRAANAGVVHASANKTSFIQSVYNQKLVEASWATEMLADKRIFFEMLVRELGAENAQARYPKTLGLREFLIRRNFLGENGSLDPSKAEEIEAALFEEFPNGFIARPAVGVSPRETSHGLFASTDAFITELIKPQTILYRPSHASKAVTSHILESVASGEAIVLQENVVSVADAKSALKQRYFQEVRVHIFESNVVKGAIPKRWVQKEILSPEQIEKAELFVADFLRQLPVSIMSRQAWSIDVAVLDNGEMRINDVVTNRGQRIAWSSYLEQPHVIAAYAKHFEANAGVEYAGLPGWLIRNGFANYFAYWKMRREKARGRGFDTFLAYLPPWPMG